MQYISTRGGTLGQFSDVLLEGLAPNGGLAVPEALPHLSAAELERLRPLTYPELATEIIGLFATDIPRDDLAGLTSRAYGDGKFAADEIVPLSELGDDMTLVGLSEGPTLAFKDMAMQFLGEALEYVLEKRDRVLNVLGATSGDTGSAAEHALRGLDRVSVFMLSPQGRMSAFQRAQMYSLQDENVHNIAVEGVFDDCQNLVKRLNTDLDFKRAHSLGAVNSINFGRISAQIVYYVWAWLRTTDEVDTDARSTFEVSFAVPSGNFGNILSGHYARSMGIPIRKLVLATNENNVLDEFFRTGHYRPRSSANTLATSSPSMDVSRASNLERFVFDLLGRDPERTAAAWHELEERDEIDLSAELNRFEEEFGLLSGTSTHDDRLATIRDFRDRTGVTIDPHTADGAKVAREHIETGIPMLVLETAKPQKFADLISEALGETVEPDDDTRALLAAPQRVTDMPDDEQQLRSYISERALHA
ncbi:threonine synthase [Microbacterium aerolatum]|uniref:Threonine synthase n=1 Tax=Microbacterium aerolatum TaxID=153731 RepID=A0A511AA30_9MICO|nr:threonine synthase [Microbacterium aerolatum]GEK85044.1 threonine synthase [Microbacterium aerolatum]GGB38224.1 threonine synthase [Microbacterium aerolatum]